MSFVVDSEWSCNFSKRQCRSSVIVLRTTRRFALVLCVGQRPLASSTMRHELNPDSPKTSRVSFHVCPHNGWLPRTESTIWRHLVVQCSGCHAHMVGKPPQKEIQVRIFQSFSLSVYPFSFFFFRPRRFREWSGQMNHRLSQDIVVKIEKTKEFLLVNFCVLL